MLLDDIRVDPADLLLLQNGAGKVGVPIATGGLPAGPNEKGQPPAATPPQLVTMVAFHRNHATILTQFWPPNSLATQQEPEGSFSHPPSAKKRYSYLPGSRKRDVFHIPFLSFFIGFTWVFH